MIQVTNININKRKVTDKPNEQSAAGQHFELGGMAVFPGAGGLAVKQTIEIPRGETEKPVQDLVGEFARMYDAGVVSSDPTTDYLMYISKSRAMGGG